MLDVLYCGDTSAQGAAAYLLGVLTYGGFSYQYINSDEKFINFKTQPAKLLILSDYPAKNITPEQQIKITNWISDGMSFWMIGGWESFYGLKGEYTGKWSKILPVRIKKNDDRVNSFLPYVLNPLNEKHQILIGLPWNQAPSIGGFNRVHVKKDSELLMTAIPLYLTNQSGVISCQQDVPVPMLVKGSYGFGTTLALMTDLAPHWTGGFVDWGRKRIQMQGKNASDVEVGHHYAQFVIQTIKYLINQSSNVNDKS